MGLGIYLARPSELDLKTFSNRRAFNRLSFVSYGIAPGALLHEKSVIPLERMPALVARGTFEHWLDGQRGLGRMLARRILAIVRARPEDAC